MLIDVPLRDQLAEATLDHQADENAHANCVPASLAAALSALTGRTFYGDELKDAVYGQGYTGATDPARFIAYCQRQGVRLWEVRDASGDALVRTIQAELGRHHPVYGAIPSMWANTTAAEIAAHGGPTHAVMFCDANSAAGTLTAMNPWPVDGHHAFYQTMPAAWWAARLVYGRVFPLAAVAVPAHPVASPAAPPAGTPAAASAAVQTDEPGAVWLPSPHRWVGANRPRYVIIHGTGSALTDRAADIARYFQQANDHSTHYVVGRDGAVVQCVRERDAAWGNGILGSGHAPWWTANPNTYTISIEHVNDAQNGTALTPAQRDASFRLVRAICQRHAIPMRAADVVGGITGHYSIDPVRRAHCPGNYPWTELWAYLRAQASLQGAFSREPDGSARDERTGVVLRAGMAAYVLEHHTAEHALSGEISYTPDASFVPCEGGLILTYDKRENVVRADRGGETLLAVWHQLAAANTSAVVNTSAAANTAAADARVHDLDGQVAELRSRLERVRAALAATPDAAGAVRAITAALDETNATTETGTV
jgi:N-acetyl-anhydromuramyl-L-alanine amidase AmpD